jgi:hypothetical protein
MRRGFLRLLWLAAWCLVLPSLLGSDCEGPNPVYPERDFVAELRPAGNLGDTGRSQLGRPHPDNAADFISDLPGFPTPVHWSGTATQLNIQMTPPIEFSAELQDNTGAPAEDSCILLDGVGSLLDRGIRGEPGSGLVGKKLVPNEYEALIAPYCLLGTEPVGHLGPLSLQEDIPQDAPLAFQAPSAVDAPGRVETTAGDPVSGAVITLFDASSPEEFLGVSLTTGVDGSFVLPVIEPPEDCGTAGSDPCPTYDILVSAPRDGSLPLPPIHLREVALPLEEGFSLLVRYPQLPLVTLRGDVVLQAGQTPFVTRLRIEGLIPAPPGGGHQFEGGLFRVETHTDLEGRFEVEVPAGQYSIRAWPTYDEARTLDVGKLDFDVPLGAELIDNLRLEIPLADFARVELLGEDGATVVGADLVLQMRESPHYRFAERTTAGLAGWAGPLMRGTYDVEVTPPLEIDPETGELTKTYARVHGVLDHSGDSSILQLFLRRSDPFEGFVYGPTSSAPGANIEGVPGVQVLILDPTTGAVLDKTTTARENGAGFFRSLLPRP